MINNKRIEEVRKSIDSYLEREGISFDELANEENKEGGFREVLEGFNEMFYDPKFTPLNINFNIGETLDGDIFGIFVKKVKVLDKDGKEIGEKHLIINDSFGEVLGNDSKELAEEIVKIEEEGNSYIVKRIK